MAYLPCTSHSAVVYGLDNETDEELLEMYFESPRSGNTSKQLVQINFCKEKHAAIVDFGQESGQ